MLRIAVPIIILALLAAGGFWVLDNPPESNRRGPPQGPQTIVETTTVASSDYQIILNSYGTVQPKTQSVMVAQVSGQIVEVSPAFRPGGFFEKGDDLLVIDPRDYEADVKISEASLMDALQAQAQEEARSEQATIDWQRLGDANEAPNDLVLRKPQLEAARARVSSARSALTKAKLDLERTHLVTPFSGRILRQMVDLGQVVNPGTQLAEVFATEFVEIRLPLKNADLAFVDLPETNSAAQPSVEIESELGDSQSWRGQIVRTEGAIDEVARQLHVVAQVDDPFAPRQANQRPLKIGEYVTAQITGKSLSNVIVIPVNTIFQNSYVYVVEEGLLQRREIDIAWQNGREAIVASGLAARDALVTTPLGQITSGTPVRIAGEQPPGRGKPQPADGVAH